MLKIFMPFDSAILSRNLSEEVTRARRLWLRPVILDLEGRDQEDRSSKPAQANSS
jgi:hypothetical protein